MTKMRDDFECPECKGEVQHNITESFCKKCGLVVDDAPIDDNDTTADGEGNIKRRRTGPPGKIWETPRSYV